MLFSVVGFGIFFLWVLLLGALGFFVCLLIFVWFRVRIGILSLHKTDATTQILVLCSMYFSV